MIRLRNQVQVIGRLGNTPEYKEFEGNKKLIRFRLAVNEYFTDAKGEKQERTQWHTLTAWGKTASNLFEYVNKGDEVAILGKLVQSTYTDSDDKTRTSTEIQIEDWLLVQRVSVPAA